MDEDILKQEQQFLKAQCDKLGGRILKLQEQLAKAKYDAKRNRSAAVLIREAYSVLDSADSTEEVATRFLKLSIEHLDLDRAMILKAKDLNHIGLLHGLEDEFIGKRLPLGNELPIFDFCNAESAATPWREQISLFANAPYWLWSWNLEKGMGLLLCRKSQDFRLRTPFDQDDRFLIEAALQVWLDILERNNAEQKIVNLNKDLEKLVEL